MSPLIEAISGTGARVEASVPLHAHTTWRVGGPADYMAWVDSAGVLAEVLTVLHGRGVGSMVLGNGSNVLVSDRGYRGVVLRLSGELADLSVDGERVIAGGGAGLRAAVEAAAKAGLTGLEFAFGIPGTVGGAVMTNAGAFSSSVSECLLSVRTLAAGESRTRERFEAGYREALVPNGEVVVATVFALARDSAAGVRARMAERASARRASQPGGATAGSVFKNPEGDHAGRLIDLCGLKGRREGGARISEVHANFIVNDGSASASDIRTLMLLAAEEVFQRFGVRLEPEVSLVGFEGLETEWWD
ncbi:MAG: UDP-N-acetylmuramate dehydrogenase [Actinobacteria bacterium]|nr:UDP-N-acetylmuramate dehydrogenase [Actinomycetota bacterium]MBU1944478.1 UDP-N-acetylmuramate dehydrogenase [Actinomycetota bacterium]MBU2688643.1 UDP-N-acetylmuramate dehydrogenase [Actinomycetota bacterium]